MQPRAEVNTVPSKRGARRILVIIATDIIGGPGKGLFQLIDQVADRPYEFVICNFDVGGRSPGQFVRTARSKGLSLKLLKQRFTLDPFLILQARRIVREQSIDIVQTHEYKSHMVGVFVRALCGVPWVGFAHGYISGGWKIRVYSWLDRKALRFADRVVTVSNALTRLLTDSGVNPKKIRLIYNAVDTTSRPSSTTTEQLKTEHGIVDGDKVVGVIGRLNPEKGHIVLLEAIRSVASREPRVKVLIIGDGRERATLESYCREHDLTRHVVFTGYRENITEYYQLLDILVMPSFSEGLPNTALEAMSFGIPVLATSVGGVPEIINQDNGVLVPPGDPATLADEMVSLLADASVRAFLGKRGQWSLYPRFAPDDRANSIIGLYDELLTSTSKQRRSPLGV